MNKRKLERLLRNIDRRWLIRQFFSWLKPRLNSGMTLETMFYTDCSGLQSRLCWLVIKYGCSKLLKSTMAGSQFQKYLIQFLVLAFLERSRSKSEHMTVFVFLEHHRNSKFSLWECRVRVVGTVHLTELFWLTKIKCETESLLWLKLY